jgi:hypothetical protein
MPLTDQGFLICSYSWKLLANPNPNQEGKASWPRMELEIPGSNEDGLELERGWWILPDRLWYLRKLDLL